MSHPPPPHLPPPHHSYHHHHQHQQHHSPHAHAQGQAAHPHPHHHQQQQQQQQQQLYPQLPYPPHHHQQQQMVAQGGYRLGGGGGTNTNPSASNRTTPGSGNTGPSTSNSTPIITAGGGTSTSTTASPSSTSTSTSASTNTTNTTTTTHHLHHGGGGGQGGGGQGGQQRTPGPNLMNQPISYDGGPWTGRTIRCELVEIQKADLGRKFARRDRRPLDPPTVCEASFYETYEVLGDGSRREVLVPAEDCPVDSLMCHVDVFPLVGNTNPSTGDPTNQFRVLPPNEGTKQTVDLWGATFCPAMKVPRCRHSDYSRGSGDPGAIYFVFSDLSVQSEGFFFFRFRIFDVQSHCLGLSTYEHPMIAEAYGGLFRVYSTKEFPGLKASTPLTKHLSHEGVKVNLRETERKRGGKREREKDKERDRYDD